MNIKDKLRLLDRESTPPHPGRKTEKADEKSLAACLGGEVMESEFGPWIRVKHQLRLPYQHGRVELNFYQQVTNRVLRLIAKNSISERFNLARTLFFDTETTGLAGGTGTYVFLIGVGYLEGESFMVEQLFLPRLEAEPAMLAYFASLLKRSQGLISFNGKSFDAPLITTRFIQHRMAPMVALHEHLDLLHAARRLVKNDFGDCSLGTLETAVLGVQRHGDIPGFEIPQIYMNFLRYGESAPLAPVLYHNRMDIISLLALAIHLAEIIDQAHHPSAPGTKAERVAKLHLDTRSPQQAAQIFANLLTNQNLRSEDQVEILLRYARTLKQLKQYDRAVQAWQEVIENKRFTLEPFIELAKHLEHREKDYAQALQYTERALSALETRFQLSPTRLLREYRQDLRHRRNRLLRKLGPREQ